MTNNTDFRILRLPEVLKLSGFGRSTLYERIKLGLFVKPIKLGQRAVGWPENEIIELNRALIAQWNNEELCKLVTQIQKSRINKILLYSKNDERK